MLFWVTDSIIALNIVQKAGKKLRGVFRKRGRGGAR